MAAVVARADRAAFVRLFERYAPKVKAHLMARGVPAGTADDLAQEVMLLLWRKASLFDATRGSLTTWLFTITRNCLSNHVRQHRHRDVELDGDLAADPAVTDTSEDEIIAAEARRELEASLRDLPAEQRDVLRDAYWRGQTLQECADQRQIPLGTVKTRVRLALARLRAIFNERGDP